MAQDKAPIRVGLSIAQTGPLSGAGKSGLLALQIWRDDVNARGGLLGRPVELVVYDDQGNPAMTPGIYTKLLDVDKVDLLDRALRDQSDGADHAAGEAPRPAADGQLRARRERADPARQVLQQPALVLGQGLAAPFLGLCSKLGAKTIAILAADAEFAQNLANGVRQELKDYGVEAVYDQNYPPSTVDFSSMIRAIRAQAARRRVRRLVPVGLDGDHPRRERDRCRRQREAVRRRHGGPAVRFHHGGAGLAAERGGELQRLGAGEDHGLSRHARVPARYQAKARQANVDPLGFYLPPFDYAIGEMLAQAVTATRSLDHKVLAKYIREHEMKTIVGPDPLWADR